MAPISNNRQIPSFPLSVTQNMGMSTRRCRICAFALKFYFESVYIVYGFGLIAEIIPHQKNSPSVPIVIQVHGN